MREVRSLYSRNLRITGAMACYCYGSCSRFADLNDHFIIYYNVNPGWINHGLWIRGYPPNSHFRWYINIHKWYGTLPIKQPRGLLIQGWHYHVYCSRVIGLQELTDWDAHPSEVLVEGGLKKLFILDKVFRSPKKKKTETHTSYHSGVLQILDRSKSQKNHCACSLMPLSKKKTTGFDPTSSAPHLSRILFRSLSFVIAADRPRICVFLESWGVI